jgi:hypothetical protein
MTKAPQEMFFVIADISGYTKFMLTPGMELTHLQGIISDLLSAVLKHIELPMAIATRATPFLCMPQKMASMIGKR